MVTIKQSASWNVHGINGLECFRANGMVHHFRRHSHEGYTIGVIEKGHGDNNYRGSVFHLSPGKIVVMNPDEVHTGVVECRHPWSYRMFYVNPEIFKDILPEKSLLPFFRGLCFEDRTWFHILQHLHRLLESDAGALERQTRFIETIANFSLAFGKVSCPVLTGKEPKAVSRVKEFIHAHFKQNITIEDLVKITQLSRAYLIRSFRSWVGMPPYNYLIQVRVKHAKVMLTQKKPIVRVAYEMGFSDQSHFTRHFKSITGITPRQYALGRQV